MIKLISKSMNEASEQSTFGYWHSWDCINFGLPYIDLHITRKVIRKKERSLELVNLYTLNLSAFNSFGEEN